MLVPDLVIEAVSANIRLGSWLIGAAVLEASTLMIYTLLDVVGSRAVVDDICGELCGPKHCVTSGFYTAKERSLFSHGKAGETQQR